MNQDSNNTLQDFIKAVRASKELIEAYSNKKCKLCLGRGKYEAFIAGASPQQFMCDCVMKNAKKAFLDE